MANLNQCNFIGTLGKDPESRFFPDGAAVCNFSIAVNERWKDKSGEKKERVEWVNIVATHGLAEVCGKYLQKGSSVFVSGKLATRKWQDKDGQDRYTTEIRADTMQMLGGRSDGDQVRRQHPDWRDRLQAAVLRLECFFVLRSDCFSGIAVLCTGKIRLCSF